jgi:hypothetical protein
VPLSGITATISTLLFDDTNYITGVAIANLASSSNTIAAVARDSLGSTIGTASIPLAANAKAALVLRNIPGLAAVAGTMGSVDLTVSTGNLAALGCDSMVRHSPPFRHRTGSVRVDDRVPRRESLA